MKKIFISLMICAFFVSGIFAWNWPWASKDEKKITMQGSTTVLPIAQKAAEVYMSKNKDIDISVAGGGSGVGIAAITDKSCDIGNASRPAKTKEVLQAKQKGVNLKGTVIANDGIAVVVNPKNKVESLTLAQLKAIYTGEITKWSQLGGSNDVIVVISRDTASGTFEVFNELVLKGSKLRSDSLMQASNKEVAETIAKTPGAIGYVGLGYISSDLKTVKIDGVTPSEETVLNKTYKIARPLYMYTNGDPDGAVKDFIDFVLSDEGQKIVKEVGYVPVK